MMADSEGSSAEHLSSNVVSRCVAANPSRNCTTSLRSAAQREGVGRGKESARKCSRAPDNRSSCLLHASKLSASTLGAQGVRCCQVNTPTNGPTSRSSAESKCQSSVRTVTAGSESPAGNSKLRRSKPSNAHALPRRPRSRALASPESAALLSTSLFVEPSQINLISDFTTSSAMAASGGYMPHKHAHASLSCANVDSHTDFEDGDSDNCTIDCAAFTRQANCSERPSSSSKAL